MSVHKRNTSPLLAQRFLSLFIGIYVAAASGALANLLAGGGGGSNAEGSGAYIVVWMGLYAAAFPLILIEIIKAVRSSISADEVIVFLFCVMVLLGCTWSVMPSESLRYSVALVMNILFAWFCFRTCSAERFLAILLWTLNVLIVVGMVAALAGLPSAFYQDPLMRGNLLGTPLIQGMFSHKIYAGFYSAIALVLNFVLLGGRARLFWVPVSAVSALLSGSSVGLTAMAMGMSSIGLLRWTRSHDFRMIAPMLMLVVITFVIGVGVVFGVSSLVESMTAVLGRDATMTGRTEIWAWGVTFWMEKPILGWGYGGIFGDSPSAPGVVVQSSQYYSAPHFHSGYLQAAAELGSVGFIFLVYVLGRTIYVSVHNYWNGRSHYDLAAGIVVITIAVTALGMNITLRYNDISTIVIFYLFLSVWTRRRSWAVPRKQADVMAWQ